MYKKINKRLSKNKDLISKFYDKDYLEDFLTSKPVFVKSFDNFVIVIKLIYDRTYKYEVLLYERIDGIESFKTKILSYNFRKSFTFENICNDIEKYIKSEVYLKVSVETEEIYSEFINDYLRTWTTEEEFNNIIDTLEEYAIYLYEDSIGRNKNFTKMVNKDKLLENILNLYNDKEINDLDKKLDRINISDYIFDNFKYNISKFDEHANISCGKFNQRINYSNDTFRFKNVILEYDQKESFDNDSGELLNKEHLVSYDKNLFVSNVNNKIILLKIKVKAHSYIDSEDYIFEDTLKFNIDDKDTIQHCIAEIRLVLQNKLSLGLEEYDSVISSDNARDFIITYNKNIIKDLQTILSILLEEYYTINKELSDLEEAFDKYSIRCMVESILKETEKEL